MIVVVIVIVCVLFAVATCFILYQLGVVPGGPDATEQHSWATPRLGARTPLQDAYRGDREWPRGCLIAVLVGAGIWFLLWGLVLILALSVLSNPFADAPPGAWQPLQHLYLGEQGTQLVLPET